MEKKFVFCADIIHVSNSKRANFHFRYSIQETETILYLLGSEDSWTYSKKSLPLSKITNERFNSTFIISVSS